MELKTLLKELPGLMSVTGYTYKSADKLRALVGDAFDEYFSDRVGNHVFIRKCGKENAPKILIDTHYDEIGMMVTKVNKGGFLSITNVGGLDMRIMQAAEVVIYGEDEKGNEKEIYGVIVSTPPHLTKPAEVKTSDVSTGASLTLYCQSAITVFLSRCSSIYLSGPGSGQ